MATLWGRCMACRLASRTPWFQAVCFPPSGHRSMPTTYPTPMSGWSPRHDAPAPLSLARPMHRNSARAQTRPMPYSDQPAIRSIQTASAVARRAVRRWHFPATWFRSQPDRTPAVRCARPPAIAVSSACAPAPAWFRCHGAASATPRYPYRARWAATSPIPHFFFQQSQAPTRSIHWPALLTRQISRRCPKST